MSGIPRARIPPVDSPFFKFRALKKLEIGASLNFDEGMELNRKLRMGLFFGILTLLPCAGAQAGFVFLRADSLDLHDFPSPPAIGTPTDDADLNGVREWQSTRTREECGRATDEAGASLMSFYGMDHAVLSPREIETVNALFQDMADDASEFIVALKVTFRRERPFQRDASIQLCVPAAKGYSYPSGHSTLGQVSARAFALLFPERAIPLLVRSNEIGLDRVIGGVHSPRDISAGQLLGDEIFDALLRSPEFMHRIDEMRSLLRNRVGAHYSAFFPPLPAIALSTHLAHRI